MIDSTIVEFSYPPIWNKLGIERGAQIRPTSLVSIVVPVHNEQDAVGPFFLEMTRALEGVNHETEYVFVNDGSWDDTLEQLINLSRSMQEKVVVVDLSRNFGKESALTAGLEFANGDAVILMDVDLQDPPNLVPEMISLWSEEGFKVVLAQRRSRRTDSFVKRKSALVFHSMFNKLSKFSLPQNIGDFRLMDRQVVTEILRLRETNRYMKGILSWVGFKFAVVAYDRQERKNGSTKFSMKSLLSLAWNGITSFSNLPLRLVTFLGVTISLIGLTYAVFLVARFFVSGADVPGYTSIIVSIFFLSGIQLFAFGVLGEYIGKIYLESKNRPLYIVNEIHENR